MDAVANSAYLTKRHEWMSMKLQQCFGLDQNAAEKAIREQKKRIDLFLQDSTTTSTLQPKLYWFYQPRQFKVPELYVVSTVENEPLDTASKCCWFVRDPTTKSINLKVGSDSSILTGECRSDILGDFEYTLQTLYYPLLQNQQDNNWGKLSRSSDIQSKFLNVVNKFDAEMKRKLTNLRGDVELRSSQAPYDNIEQKPASYAAASKNKQCMEHFQEIVGSWCEQISKYMSDDPSNLPLDKNNDEGPAVEFEYWSRRMLTLISITEQLKMKKNRVITGVLKARAIRTDENDSGVGNIPNDGLGNGGNAGNNNEADQVRALLERWRDVDLAISDALNEAKDNVRFLDNLQKVIEPLSGSESSSQQLIDSMPSLMNSLKMIHTLSRHYGTEVRMTNLFERITNQLITRCKQDIYNNQPISQLWSTDAEVVTQRMKQCIAVYEAYKQHYSETRLRLAQMPNGKQFSFDEQVIFGKLIKFRRRLEKLLDMFSSISQFHLLELQRIDGMETLITNFHTMINDFTLKGHDLLDINNTVFERDYLEFTMQNSGLENAIQSFMSASLEAQGSIDKQITLLQRFAGILQRQSLQEDVQQKFLQIFRAYNDELYQIQATYERFKDSAPIPRNMSRIAGNIQWSRQLLRRITIPMSKFQQVPTVFHPKENKKTVKHYNKLARILIEFETLWYNAWLKSTENAKRGLRSRLIVQDPATGKYHVNFDLGVLQLIREAKHLQLMGFELPASARVVLLLENQLKSHYHSLVAALNSYHRVLASVPGVCRSVLQPHMDDLEAALRPAATMMSWTSMNIQSFLQQFNAVLGRFEYLVNQLNDMIQNRITNNLYLISATHLLTLPSSKTFTVRDFAPVQRQYMDETSERLIAKNEEIERAVDDLLESISTYPLHPEIQKPTAVELGLVKMHYCHMLYAAIQAATKRSITQLRQRLSSHSQDQAPLFELELSLSMPAVTFNPTLEEVAESINSVARDMLHSTKKIYDWGLDLPVLTSSVTTNVLTKRSRRSFYERLIGEKQLAINLLLLTGSIESCKVILQSYMKKYNQYSWLWLQDPEQTYARFMTQSAQTPVLEDFVCELHKFVEVEREVVALPSVEQLSCFHLSTDALKSSLKHEIERWKHQYSEKLHAEAKVDMDRMTEMISDLKNKLEREVKDFASLKFVMDAQAEVREVSSYIDVEFDSIIERYNTLERYLPFGAMSKDEMDSKSVLRTTWQTILVTSNQVMQQVANLQGGYKQDLIDNVKLFKQAVKSFRVDYDQNGPMVRGTTPAEAMNRLAKYKREFETLNRKYELYNGGEKLFGLPEQQYPDLAKTRKELRLLDQLYTLYQQVISTVDEYKSIPWSEVVANINTMNDTIQQFSSRCRHLPKGLKTWEAYQELNQTIEDFIEVLPLLTELSKPAMRSRHWAKISKLTGKSFEQEKFHEMKLRSVLEANLLQYREDIEEITDSAEKQLSIERKLSEISALWDVASFELSGWKDRGDVILAGSSVTEIIEQLEDSQSSLVQMLTQRHVTPFKDQANAWLKKLSDVNDTLENWIKVQMLWMSLEAVFTGGDIARQMPSDTRVFMKVDKEWSTRLMAKAKDVKIAVECCQNEYIKNMLPTMFTDLEKCQKALDGYLEQKRSKFPRFYFVSNPALLLILSQGSDKEAVQQCFSKVFDAVDRVEFVGNNISKIRQLQAGADGVMDSEDIILSKPVAAKGNIEEWLTLLLKEMRRTMKDIVRSGANDFEAMQWSDFIRKYPAQVSLLAIQFMWTADVQEALIRTKHDKMAMSTALKKQSAVLTELSSMTTQPMSSKLERTKIETLVTIQVHQKDVLQELHARHREKKLKDAHDFEWQKQLRCYWVPEDDECVVKIADVEFDYCYEYLGCKERLVVTPLTDRCYISLSQAIGMCFGGAPAGPAGTGKTETVKDLGRALGKLVVVFNCSDQMHTADTAKIYKGLCQSGAWGCFDEFNRIDLEVLSVVAQQVQAVLNAIRSQATEFLFPGDSEAITIDSRCGFFITMNPGYAGRQELPENLKALFRGVTMMVPDREIIIRVKLASVGYLDYAPLAKKFRVLYNLCEEQLSKQRHYDFGLRNILSVLRTAGINLRVELSKDGNQERSSLEEMLMMRTLRDMNLSKLVADDVELFISLLHDLFPNQRDPEKRRYDSEEEALRQVISEQRLIQHDSWVNKIVQLYETSLVRHGLMMVGPAGGGKSTAIKVLIDALTLCKDKHMIVRMNPKAIKAEEMFGSNNLVSGEWTHGIFSSIWQKYNDPKKHCTWIVCDGPVDAIWIENLNTVLDDNKLLTLANGDRIPMTDNVRLLFEVEDLRNASPATVSRAGIIFVSASDLGYEPIVQAWLQNRSREEEAQVIRTLYDHYITQSQIFFYLQRNVRHVIPVSQAHLITNCFTLLEGLLLADPSNSSGGAETSEQRQYTETQLERLFLYALCWSLGALLEVEDRIKFSTFLCKEAQKRGGNLPTLDASQHETLYEYFVNAQTMEWEWWEAAEWVYNADHFNFSTCLVPTVDSVRAEYLINICNTVLHQPVLIAGSSGTAKTSVILQYTNQFDSSKMLLKKVNFSSATTAGMFQQSIEADIEKRQGKTYAPAAGRWMTVFLDDISMPEVNKWGDQPTLELVRQLIESGGFYFLEKDKRGDKKQIENIRYVAAMSHPGGGRNDIPNRLKRHFYMFNMTPPSQSSIDNIYGSMLRGRLEDQPPALIEVVPQITAATIELWLAVRQRMLPTPSKFHYIFNLRDLSRIFQGVLHSPIEVVAQQPSTLLSLWKHECERVFSDKLTNPKDKQWYLETSQKIITQKFTPSQYTDTILHQTADPSYFVDFLRDEIVDEETEEVLEEAPKIYEPVNDVTALRARVEEFLHSYNQLSGIKQMDLVLFKDALEHMMRISRILSLPRGNALLVGVGGSGRQSLTRLAAYIARHEVFQISITRNYKMADFLDDIRKLYVMVGKEGKKVTWILSDFEIINEDMLEYVNAILSTGEIAGLFPKDERDMMCSDLRGPARKERHDFVDTPDNLYKYFIDRIRDNLHIVLCFSPANEKFAERARRFPALISGCTIDWFLRWPEQALVDVSHKFLTEDPTFKIEAETTVEKSLVRHIATVHSMVTEACDEYLQKYRRHVYVTPKSYLAYIKSFKQLYGEKLTGITIQQRNVETGLRKLRDAEVDVVRLQGVLEQQNVELSVAEKAATAMLAKLEIGAKEANLKKAAADTIEAKCLATANQINAEKAAANKELEAAMPFVHAAEQAARSINKKDIGIIQKLSKPPDLIKRIMDCVLILNLRPLERTTLCEIKTGKTSNQIFLSDSYDSYAKKMMVESGFITTLLAFSTDEKDSINDETMEFLQPYLDCADFTSDRAKTVASAAEGLCKWVRAMASYHEASLIVAPKMEQLEIKTNMHSAAMSKLKQAKATSQAAQDEVDKLQAAFSQTMKEKSDLEQQAKATQDKMVAANNLIKSLAGEKKRWNADALIFAEDKKRLVGNCALACAFVSYLGPFNSEFRGKLLQQYFLQDCIQQHIPVSQDLDVNKFLVTDATIAEWNSQTLPKDDLSIQNGILVTQASRYPLLVDPQGQALNWLKKREAANFPIWGTTSMTHPKLRDQLEFCMENGKPLLIEGVVKDVDPLLDPVLEKNIITRGRSQYIMVGDKQVQIDPKFRLYLITKLANPIFSPELSAKTTIIDFSVTQVGLEEQLLSRVIQSEQKSLEEQRQKLIEEVNYNTISLQQLDSQLLERLSASQGNLLDDVALIGVLADTKTKAQEVKEKIEASVTTEQIINKRREHYRPVATRGSVLYFVIVAMSQINCMYQTSLAQFLQWFDQSLIDTEKANVVSKRVELLMKHLTYEVYVNVNRGLFEVDKLSFKLMITLKILLTESGDITAIVNAAAGGSGSHQGLIDENMVQLLLRGGAAAALDAINVKKPYEWLQPNTWMNILHFTTALDVFADLRNSVEQNESEWKKWYESESPESLPIPRLEDRLDAHPAGHFLRFLLVRGFRDDRLRMAAQIFISAVLGQQYIEPIPTKVEDIYRVSDCYTPVILLLTPGADPTSQLEELSKKRGIKLQAVSMGEGQEPYAYRAMHSSMEDGGWVLLQNTHLGLGFMTHVEDDIRKAKEEGKIHENFRFWITCEQHPDFPINLLQMSIKVTNEPPRGIKAGLMRSYTSVVDSERLTRVESKEWRDLMYTLCFLHSTVQERRKYGPIGWCIPYEFNSGDLEASLTFLEKHCFTHSGLSWQTIRYMICQIQYGGRITDELDRQLFDTFGKQWLHPNVFSSDFQFTSGYGLPQSDSLEGIRKYISDLPSYDIPELFGLHANADLIYGTNEAMYILNAIAETQPKSSAASASTDKSKQSKTREETVYDKADELLALLPSTMKDDEIRDYIRKRSKQENEFVLGTKSSDATQVDGFSIPLNIFLYQEVTRLNTTIKRVSTTLQDLKQAINGEIIMTPELQAALNSVFNEKPPLHWYIDASGMEIAWVLPSLSLWITGLIEREKQLTGWLLNTRPLTYWLTGFFNPQGFLTATRQEITRRHKADKWALDDVVLVATMTEYLDVKKIKAPPSEGVYIHGLYLEGCSWDRRDGKLTESHPKELYTQLPVVQVSAMTSKQAEKLYGGKDAAYFYDCPVYKQPKRTDKNYIFSIKLRTTIDPDHWALRGVALLCSKET